MNRTGISNLALVFCSCLMLFLAACGQRGPLYLPEPEQQAATGAGAEELVEENADKVDQQDGEDLGEESGEELDEETP